MTASDILKLISILLAIIAFISEKNRIYIFLKFAKLHLTFLIIAFVYIHYLFSYSWWLQKIPFLQYFEWTNFIPPATWAYLISISLIIYILQRIFLSDFPLENREKVIKYYQKLIIKNETIFLSELIEKHHLKDITEFLRIRKFNNNIRNRSFLYGNNVYFEIILNDKFINQLANKKPDFFAKIIQNLSYKTNNEEVEFVNTFLGILTREKNYDFFREIRNTQNLTHLGNYEIPKEYIIIHSLFDDIKVAVYNEIWRGIAEVALLELEEEVDKNSILRKKKRKRNPEEVLWKYKITYAIHYFDIMLRQAIVQQSKHHMWLFFYNTFVEEILNNMVVMTDDNSEINRLSYNYWLLEKIFSNMIDWKAVCVKSSKMCLISAIYQCIIKCIYSVSISNKLSESDKYYLVNWVWEDLIETNYCSQENIEIVLNVGFKAFYKKGFKTENTKYVQCLKKVWNDRNTAKFDDTDKLEIVQRFKLEVIDRL